VVVLTTSLPHYRVPFFDSLRSTLRERGIDLHLIHGQSSTRGRGRGDEGALTWATRIRNITVPVGGRELVWQPALRDALRSELVVVEQASRLMINYVLLAAQIGAGARLAFWGHGANMQGHRANRLGEAVKRAASRAPHWWFAYTEASRDRVVALGYPSSRVTVVQNAIDTRDLAAAVDGVTDEQIARFRASNSLGDGPVGVFIGGLYDDKRLSFLFQAAARVAEWHPGFRLVVIGDGPDRSLVEAAARAPYGRWLRYLGPQFSACKAVALRTARVSLLPGLVGLGVLDAFAARTPLVTTQVAYHSPEIEYLVDGVNGLVVSSPDDPAAYAHGVISILEDPLLRERLREGCAAAAATYTLEEMVARFANGVTSALGHRLHRHHPVAASS